MKRFFVVLIVLCLCIGFSYAEGLSLTEIGFSSDLTPVPKSDIQLSDATSYDAEGMDTVNVDNEIYTVVGSDATYVLDLSQFPSFVTFTQDLYASFRAYLCMEHPYEFQKYLIDNQIHFLILDAETNMQVYIYLRGMDDLSSFVNDLALLSESDQKIVASMIASDSSVEVLGNQPWIQVSDSMLITFFNGYIIGVEFGGSGDMEADLQDVKAILSCLELK